MPRIHQNRNNALGCAVSLLLMGLAGCTTTNVTRVPSTPALLPFSDSGESVMPDRWWLAFDDSALDLQVNRALGENFNLSAALQRLCAARALTRREASDLFPDLDGFIGANTSLGPGPNRNGIDWGLSASYQVDLWGEIQSRVDAERFRADATLADYHAVALSLAAEVARTWYALVEAHAQLELLDEQEENNRKGLKSQELRFGSGLVSRADVLRQRQLVQSTLEQAVVVRARVEVLEHQLAVLLGELPQAANFDPGSKLPELAPLPYAGLPSELLMRRPDVRGNYLAYVAADRDLASAISAQYPRLNLTGSLVNAATSPSNLFRDWFLSIGGQLIAPLCDGGQRQAEVERTAAIVCQRSDEYQQSMLVAFREVEDALSNERYQIQRIERLNSQVELAKQAYESLFDRYLIGDANYLDTLSAIQSQQRLQREVLSARLDLILIRIGLYLALAGDFDTTPQAVTVMPSADELIDDALSEETEADEPDTDQDKTDLPSPLDLPPDLRDFPPDLREFFPPDLRVMPPNLQELPLPPVPKVLANSIDE